MWATVVDRHGVVVAVAHSGTGVGDQWLGSRAISAQKANTANDFSLDGLALSSADLWAPTQPGGSLFGLQESNPVDVAVVYGGDFDSYGTESDFMVGKEAGRHQCLRRRTGALRRHRRSHWGGRPERRHLMRRPQHRMAGAGWPRPEFCCGLGVDADLTDDIIYDLADDGNGHFVSASGFGHPICGFGEDAFDMAAELPLQ
jgi:hypothetical protein